VKPADLLRRLRRRAARLGMEHSETDGKGSHLKLRHGGHATVVPLHRGDLPAGTYRAILRQLGLTDQNLED
jgi:predicted RNA binding protein YcfA (HicA-like mRNA interferase family)